jgi:glycosyltransferase involved in cell wall biosynthesis
MFVEPQGLYSRAMLRVSGALKKYAPTSDADHAYRFVDTEAEADVVVLHVIGYPETLEAVKRLTARNQKYVIIQYCLRTTQQPLTLEWLPIWQGAEVVWSYYDLREAIRQDCESDNEGIEQIAHSFNFYLGPMGVDPDVFKPFDAAARKFTVFTSGYVAETEGVAECAEAVKRIGGQQYHLGPSNFGLGEHVFSRHDINDALLAQAYSMCKYVAGLRRGEGFEVPVLEGALCRARPVCFDREHYRLWFNDFAIFVPEGSFEETTDALQAVFQNDPVPISDEERAKIVARFAWSRVIGEFYDRFTRNRRRTAVLPPRSTTARRMLFVGDAVVSTGFAKNTHHLLSGAQPEWEVSVVGLNYHGDPHEYPYPIYPASRGGGEDGFGIARLPDLIKTIGPDVVVIQNDPWNLPAYMQTTLGMKVPTVAILAVDGLNCRGRALNGLAGAIFWTQFGQVTAAKGGYTGPSYVLPLGVDTGIYKPGDRETARRAAGLPANRIPPGSFIVGNVNRNQPRKRLDLSIAYFAEWVKTRQIPDAFLYLHVAPTGDAGWDILQLSQYYNITNRVICIQPEIGFGDSEESLANTYRCFDVQINTGQGEGFGLTTIEGMACGIPQIVGEWAAFGPQGWVENAAIKIPCTSTYTTPGEINSIGGIPDRKLFIEALDAVYQDHQLRQNASSRGLELVNRPVFRWPTLSEQFSAIVSEIIDTNSLFDVA